VRRAAIAAVAALMLSGCGIRATTVPVDAGAAPSRSRCVEPDTAPSLTPSHTTPHAPSGSYRLDGTVLYLVCNAQLTERKRAAELRGGYLEVARSLLDQLRTAPEQAERANGYDTAVPDALRLTGPRTGDPAGTLRLDMRLDELPDFALGQLVCTLSDNLLGDGPVLIGGKGDSQVRRFTCNTALRTQEGPEPDTGVPVT
jgi:hypothetical protein